MLHTFGDQKCLQNFVWEETSQKAFSQTNSPPPRTIYHYACISHMAKIITCVTSDPFTSISRTCICKLVPNCAVLSLVISCVLTQHPGCLSPPDSTRAMNQVLYRTLSTLVPCCYLHCLVVLILGLALWICFHNLSLLRTLSLQQIKLSIPLQGRHL